MKLADDIAALEASLDAPSTPATEALATALAARLATVAASDPPASRELAVRGLLVSCHQHYRTGGIAAAGGLLRAAVALCDGIDPALRIKVLLRSGEIALLDHDVGSALQFTSDALALARERGKPGEEAQAWVAYGMALDSAGLFALADAHWTHALRVLGEGADARLRGNIWALRCPLGFRLRADRHEAAEDTCRQALACALETPSRFRDSMACTALCNWAALDIQRGHVPEALAHLDRAAGYPNVGVRPRWLVAVLRAMAAVRERNDADRRAALDALLAPDQAPAIAYVIESYAVLAAMYAEMGDAEHAGETLARLSRERARSLWAMLRGPRFTGTPVPVGFAAPPEAGVPAGDPGELLVRLAVTAELRDDATGRHCYRVGRLALLLGRRVGLPEADLDGLELAARLHDIGKLVIPDAILLKPGRLDPTETHLMRSHAAIGAEILAGSALAAAESARAIARHHHERWDGTGYPDGLAGEAIPVAARLAALADVYDALTHERPYKPAWPHEQAVAYIAGERGAQFDPRLVDHFLAMMAEARADLVAFLGNLESAADGSPYVLAQTRVAQVLGADGEG